MTERGSRPGLIASLAPSMAPGVGDQGAGARVWDLAEIDRSTRGPVLFFFGGALFWLVLGSVLGLISSIEMGFPDLFFPGTDWLTFGRLRPAHLGVVVYGWASQAGVGVGLWLMARLCRVPLLHGRWVVAAGTLWNIGVASGVAGLLAGRSTGIEWIEFPNHAALTLFVAYALIAVWGIVMFRFRRPGHVYVSQWYLLLAFFGFPWVYGTANLMLNFAPIQGSAQGAVNWWFAHNVLGLWFTPIGIASAYYMIPKVIGRPVHSYPLSVFGFWTLALFYSWNGMHHLIGGPFPAWMISASVVASVMMCIPVTTVAVNHHMTLRRDFDALRWSPTLRFTVFGAMSYTVVSLQGSAMALRQLNPITHFTHYTVGHAHLGLYAFFTMTMFGAMYYVAPRLVGRPWPSARLIRWHFWLAASGVILMFGALTAGGLLQGIAMADPAILFGAITAMLTPFLNARALSGALLLAAHVVFAASFLLLLLRAGGRRDAPDLSHTPGPPDAPAPGPGVRR